MKLDTNTLKINDTFKNYKELCAYLGEEPKKANSKVAQLKEWERYFSFRKEGQKIIITEVFDLETKGSEVLTRNGFLEIKGTNIAVQGQNEEVGLYFVNTEDESKNVKLGAEKLGRNTSGSLCGVVPSELEEGTYRLMIRTQSLSGKVLSKEIKECVSEQTFRIG